MYGLCTDNNHLVIAQWTEGVNLATSSRDHCGWEAIDQLLVPIDKYRRQFTSPLTILTNNDKRVLNRKKTGDALCDRRKEVGVETIYRQTIKNCSESLIAL